MTKEKPLKIYRVTYRAKVGIMALVGQIDLKTRKEKWEIDHEKIIDAYLRVNKREAVFDEILMCEEIK